MVKRILTLVLIFSFTLSLSGCANIFRKEQLYVSKYTDNPNDSDEVINIPDYVRLKSAVKQMVEDHSTEAKFIFSSYEGDLQNDLSQLGWEIKSEDALAGFCVDYISYDLNRIVTYYEALVHITYKRTAEEVSEIVPVAGFTGFCEEISDALASSKTEIVVQWVSRNLTEDDVVKAIMDVYYSNPAASVVTPTPKVTVYNSAILHNIVEIELDYGYTDAELQTMKANLAQKVNKFVDSSSSDEITSFLSEAYSTLVHVCKYDPVGNIRNNNHELEGNLGSTVYGALVEGYADSLGVALAFSTICNSEGIKCSVLKGSYNQVEHWWNIISIKDKYWHIDVSAYHILGLEASSLKSDAQMQANGYRWDTSNFPQYFSVA